MTNKAKKELMAMTKKELINKMIENGYCREKDRTYFMNKTKEHAVLTFEAFADSYSFKIRHGIR